MIVLSSDRYNRNLQVQVNESRLKFLVMIDSESRFEMAAAGMIGTLVKDPVCGADVSVKKAEKAGRKSTSLNRVYYFCCEDCKRQFEKNPERYAMQ